MCSAPSPPPPLQIIIVFLHQCFMRACFLQEWTSEYEDMRMKNKTHTAAKTGTTEVQKMKKVMLEKTKNIVREVCLYFIDWVIE